LDELVEKFRSERARRIVLDLSDVKHIDSVGVGTLAMLLKDVMATSRTLVLVAGDGVREILAASSLQDAFQFAPSVQAALA
jgi:anti-anti-sigma factor